MRIRFAETMQGELRTAAGVEAPVSFSVDARSEGVGVFALSGSVQAPPWAEGAPAEGTLTMSVLERSIAYVVRFTAKDGSAMVLEGRKHPSPFAPLQSMTEMPVSLKDAQGTVVASGAMRFDLKDLPGFLASWLPFGRSAGSAG